jgi:hypothetical protein
MSDTETLSPDEPGDMEMAEKWARFADRVEQCAAMICWGEPEDKDDDGNPAFPCAACTKVVKKLAEVWAMYQLQDADIAADKMRKTGVIPALSVAQAYTVAAGTLDPDHVVSVARYGAL